MRVTGRKPVGFTSALPLWPVDRLSAAIHWKRLGWTAPGLSESSVECDGLGLEMAAVMSAWSTGSGDVGVARRQRRGADVAQLAVDVLATEGDPNELLNLTATCAVPLSGSSRPRKQPVLRTKMPLTGRKPWDLKPIKTSFHCVMVSSDLRQMQRQPRYPALRSKGWIAVNCKGKRSRGGISVLNWWTIQGILARSRDRTC